MKFDDFSPLNEGSFDDMVAQLGNLQKGPGRWPAKDPEPSKSKVVRTPGATIHKADKNYSGKGYAPHADSKWRGANADPHLSLPAGGKMGGSHTTRSFTEDTGDEKFDSMMSHITGNNEPKARFGNMQLDPDDKTRELTHKIFLALRDYDDPVIYRKFIDFMRQTLDPRIGPVEP